MNHLMCKTTSSNHIRGKPTYHKARSKIKLEDLPEDVLCTILSKLPPKEVSRASVVSTNWRYICGICCFKLSFSGVDGCCRDSFDRQQYCQYIQKFINNANAVMQKCRGMVVEEFKVKFEFDSMLVDHLNNWVTFALSSGTKNIAFYLCPLNKRHSDKDRYIFPSHLLDSASISRLQCIQLSFVSFTPPSEFRGFPSLRKLDLEFVHITRKDLEVILSNCCNLEWLSLVRCYLNGELKLDRPLPHLLHLIVVHCKVTKIELRVKKLVTFVYDGGFVPIVLNQDSKLENAHIWFSGPKFEDAVAALLNGIPSIQNLTLQMSLLETESLLNNTGKFSNLRCLQLLMGITDEHIDKVPYVVSVLRAAPLIEKFEIHFASGDDIWFANMGSCRPHLEQCEYKYLKSMYITGYKGATGQLELLLHVVENAPALEVLTVEATQKLFDDGYAALYGGGVNPRYKRAAEHARYYLGGKIPPRVKLCVL